MPNTLTTAQLQVLTNQLATTSPGAANFQSVVNGVYSQLAAQGYGYANLAAGLVTCSTLSGKVAQNFMANFASAQGSSLSNAQIQNIELGMANAYIDALSAMSKASGAVNTDITYQQALQFHTAVFASNHLGAGAWTLFAPGQVLNPQSMESLWQQIISTNSRTSLTASAYLFNIMGALGGYAPDTAPNLSNEGVIAANWTSAAELAGLTSVFSGSNACSVGSTTLTDELGNSITAQVGALSGTNGSYALATTGNIEYLMARARCQLPMPVL
jgi:hypothetical protein